MLLRSALACALLLVAACGATPGPVGAAASPDGGSSTNDAVTGELTVLAAASLTDAFEAVAERLGALHPDLSITLGFAGSQQLAAQIAAGAPADVFASANDVQMQRVADAGLLAGEPVVVASNRLAIAVETGNPRAVQGLADLADDDVAVVLAAEAVPAGRAARSVLDAAGVRVDPVSLEADVRSVLSKVALGEADAGLVYSSDVVTAAARVDSVRIPDDENVDVRYPVAVLADAPNPVAARAFVDFLRSTEGRSVLADVGFRAP